MAAATRAPGFPLPLPSLAGAAFLRQPRLAAVVGALEKAGGRACVVGGSVRDALIGRPVREVDIATTLTPHDASRACLQAGLKAVPTGIEHGTVTVICDGMPFEVTTLRRDVRTDGRRAVVAFTADWAEDASRRDFTMNALYAALDGTVFDPVGGYRDLAARRVRFIGDARARIREDYLRILRLFRFHAEFGRGDPDAAGLAAAAELASGLAGLSRERVRQELMRLLDAPGAAPAVAAMERSGIFAALGLASPHVERFAALKATGRMRAGEDAVLALAALLLAPRHGRDAEALAARLRLARDETRRLAALEGWEGVSPALGGKERAELCYRAGGGAARDRALLAWAACGAPADDAGWGALVDFTETWTSPEFPLKGRDLLRLGIARGPALGRALAALESHWIESGFAPDRQALLARARDMKGESG